MPTIAVETPSAAPTTGSNAMLPNGIPAATSTIPMVRRNAIQPGAARTAPSAAGAPALTRAPASSATRPAAMAGVTSGTTTRFTAGR